MYTDDKSNVERIALKIIAAIKSESGDHQEILNALAHVFTFFMAVNCPDCRKNVARQLRKRIPEMLFEANRLAAMSLGPERDDHVH
jgi:hypothetical protein